MASRKDQLHSYQFMLQRVISAVVMRETDPAQAPLRRGAGAIFAGVMVAVIVAGGFGIIGIFTKIGSTTWKQDGTVVVERETGATYLYNSGELTPMLNYASALLLSGKQPPVTATVSRNALTSVPRGVMRGIQNAPDELPDTGKIVGAPWTLCSVPTQDAAGHATTDTSLAVGQSPVGGRSLANRALLTVDSQNGATFLVWHSTRYRINDPETLVPSLFGAQVSPTTVGLAWLNGLSTGADIGPITIQDQGSASGSVSGYTVGDVIFDRTGTGARQYYLVFSDGVAPITDLQLAILRGQYSVQPKEALTNDVNAMAKSSQLPQPAADEVRPPQSVPTLADASTGDTCAIYQDAGSASSVLIDATFPAIGDGTQTQQQTSAGNTLADRVAVPAGQIAVVRAMASPTATDGSYSLVTDNGVRYGVPSASVLGTLGYSTADAVDMPAGLVSRIPAGPMLDPQAAAKPVDTQTGSD